MARKLVVAIAIASAIAIVLYAAYSMDLIGMIIRGHAGMAGGHGG